MNISTARLEANEGNGLESGERPSYVEDALEAPHEVGYREGKPLVPQDPDADDGLKLGDDPTEAYDHYPRGSLLLPENGDFVRRLFEAPEVGGVADAAEEVNTNESTVRKAAELHGVDIPLESADDDGSEDDDIITLPSGEAVNFGPLHPLVLAQLLSDGMSVEEAALYLSKEAGEAVDATDVREAAETARLLPSPSPDDGVSNPIPPAKKTAKAQSGEPASTPW